MSKHVAIYLRVSSARQDTKSQEPDLKRWADGQDQPVKWYTDKSSGKSMNRPQWNKLEEAVRMNRVSTILVWRIDRLGRTASGLTKLFDELQGRKVNLVSLKDGLDLATAAGRLMANVLASIAQFETEIRAERIIAGMNAKREEAERAGKPWNRGGSPKGVRKVVTTLQERTIKRLRAEGEPIAAIARTVKLSRPTIYSVLGS